MRSGRYERSGGWKSSALSGWTVGGRSRAGVVVVNGVADGKALEGVRVAVVQRWDHEG